MFHIAFPIILPATTGRTFAGSGGGIWKLVVADDTNGNQQVHEQRTLSLVQNCINDTNHSIISSGSFVYREKCSVILEKNESNNTQRKMIPSAAQANERMCGHVVQLRSDNINIKNINIRSYKLSQIHGKFGDVSSFIDQTDLLNYKCQW